MYDKNGNCIERKTKDYSFYYTYDALNRLTSVTDGANVTFYLYDSLHRRIGRITNKGTEYFLHLGLREIGLLDVEGKVAEFRTLGLGKGAELGAAIGVELHGTVFCPVHDHRGNIVALVDPATSNVRESYRYTAFGEREVYDNNGLQCGKSRVGNPWGFASKRYDEESGFVYFSKRYYEPQQGRWLIPDPLGFADGPNLYAYVHNNPMTKFDLYGLYGLMDDADFDLNAQVATAELLEHFAIEFAIAEAHAAVGMVSLGIGAAQYTAALASNPNQTISNTQDALSNISFASVASSMVEGMKNDPAKAIANAVSTLTNPTGWLKKSIETKALVAVGRDAKITMQMKKTVPSSKVEHSVDAENINAGVYLNRKLSQIESAQNTATKTIHLPDGRIRYYEAPRPARNPGPTKESSYVTEFNPLTGKTRGWNECYDHSGKVNRVHPKDINGQKVAAPHYPPTKKELNNDLRQ